MYKERMLAELRNSFKRRKGNGFSWLHWKSKVVKLLSIRNVLQTISVVNI